MKLLRNSFRPLLFIPRFLGEVRTELSQVAWVKGRELYRYTTIVVLYCVLLTVLVYIIDLIMVALRSRLIGTVTL